MRATFFSHSLLRDCKSRHAPDNRNASKVGRVLPMRFGAVTHRPRRTLRQAIISGKENLHQYSKTVCIVANIFDDSRRLAFRMFGEKGLANVHILRYC